MKTPCQHEESLEESFYSDEAGSAAEAGVAGVTHYGSPLGTTDVRVGSRLVAGLSSHSGMCSSIAGLYHQVQGAPPHPKW